MPPGVGFLLVFIGPEGGGFKLFLPGGEELAHQKIAPGDGQAWN